MIEKPEALLRRRQRDIFCFWQHNRRARLFRAADQFVELDDSGLREHGHERDVYAKFRGQTRGDAGRLQGLAAQAEERIRHADLIEVQDVFPDFCDERFPRVARQDQFVG